LGYALSVTHRIKEKLNQSRYVIPAQAGIQWVNFLGSRLRGNDDMFSTSLLPPKNSAFPGAIFSSFGYEISI
jgi:hypothetical protein